MKHETITTIETTACRACGEICDTNEEDFCERCDFVGYHACCDCGEPTSDYYLTDSGERGACRDCAAECFDCGRPFEEGYDYGENSDGDRICHVCLENYCYCEDCGEIMHIEDDSVFTTYQGCFCDYCFYARYYFCDDCGEPVLHEDAYIIDDVAYCESCADDRRSDIGSWSYEPELEFYGEHSTTAPLEAPIEGYYGVELEIDNSHESDALIGDLREITSGELYFKEDGSLSIGFELVTMPLSLNYHLKRFPWEGICSAALRHGYRSHETDTCGLHVHASRSCFGDTYDERDLTIAKIILLVDRFFEREITRFARRSADKIAQWARKPNADICIEDDEYLARRKAELAGKYTRYTAVNLTNHATVEFRFFRGTLKASTILASIQLVDYLIAYARATPLAKIFDVTWEDIFENCEQHELLAYMQDRRLLATEATATAAKGGEAD